MASKILLDFFKSGEPTSSKVDLAASLPFIVTSIIAVVLAVYLRSPVSQNNFPTLNPKNKLNVRDGSWLTDFRSNMKPLLTEWFKANPDKPVMINADMGVITCLPPKYVDEIRNDKRLDFSAFARKFLHSDLKGFEAFNINAAAGGEDLVQKVVIKNLTKELNKVTKPLAEETAHGLSILFTDQRDWHEVQLRETVLRLVARISSRVFLGPELCRNEEWLRVTREFTVASFGAADDLRTWPRITRPIVNQFLPSCRKNRAFLKEAQRVIQPVIDNRKKIKAEAAAKGCPAPEYNDAIEWFEMNSKNKNYSPSLCQLVLSAAAIHTTTDLVAGVLLDLAQRPEAVKALREEIISVINEEGWTKNALFRMKLLDSAIKETQRMKPMGMAAMSRVATEDVTLSDGTFIAKDGMIVVSAHSMWDSEVHDNAETWDLYRFHNMRQDPEKQHFAHLVSTSANHLAFGHGQHACPGRFFAANEVKIAIASVLLKYDICLPEGAKPKHLTRGMSMSADPFINLKICRRDSEIDF